MWAWYSLHEMLHGKIGVIVEYNFVSTNIDFRGRWPATPKSRWSKKTQGHIALKSVGSSLTVNSYLQKESTPPPPSTPGDWSELEQTNSSDLQPYCWDSNSLHIVSLLQSLQSLSVLSHCLSVPLSQVVLDVWYWWHGGGGTQPSVGVQFKTTGPLSSVVVVMEEWVGGGGGREREERWGGGVQKGKSSIAYTHAGSLFGDL